MVTRRFFAGLTLSLALAGPLQAAPPTTAILGTPPQPGWGLLSTQQKIILAPLVGEWDQMENIRRKKWLGIAERFPKMTADEQARVQDRMREWASLTPDQRSKVRGSYKEFNQLDTEKKLAVKKKWEAYSNLTEEEKIRVRQAKPSPSPIQPVESSPPDAASSVAQPVTVPQNAEAAKP